MFRGAEGKTTKYSFHDLVMVGLELETNKLENELMSFAAHKVLGRPSAFCRLEQSKSVFLPLIVTQFCFLDIFLSALYLSHRPALICDTQDLIGIITISGKVRTLDES